MKDGFKRSFMAEWVNWENSDELLFKKLRTKEDLRHSKKSFCVSFGILLGIIIGVVKMKDTH